MQQYSSKCFAYAVVLEFQNGNTKYTEYVLIDKYVHQCSSTWSSGFSYKFSFILHLISSLAIHIEKNALNTWSIPGNLPQIQYVLACSIHCIQEGHLITWMVVICTFHLHEENNSYMRLKSGVRWEKNCHLPWTVENTEGTGVVPYDYKCWHILPHVPLSWDEPSIEVIQKWNNAPHCMGQLLVCVAAVLWWSCCKHWYNMLAPLWPGTSTVGCMSNV